MDKESIEAAKEIAKTTGKGIDAGRDLGKFISRYTHGTLEEAFGIIEDRLKYMRLERQIRLMIRAQELLQEAGLDKPTRRIPFKFAIPLLQGASLEEDDSLQDLFAALLVNFANADSDVEMNMAYIDILKRISPLEAKILDRVYSFSLDEVAHKTLLTAELPESVSIRPPKDKDDHPLPSEDVQLALINLDRLGCLSVAKSWGGGFLLWGVIPSPFGYYLVEACRIRKD